MWTCPSCGTRNDSMFCTHCGAREAASTSTYGSGSLPYSASPIPTRSVIKQNAKIAISLQSKTTVRLWLAVLGIEIGVGLVIGLIFTLAWPVGFFFACIFYLQILQCGQLYAGVKLYRKQHIEVKDAHLGFKNYSHMLGGTLWWLLWCALWGCIPVMNVIKVYSYCLTPFILMDHPEMTSQQALKRSIQMTEGRKLDIFVLELSFIGWHLLNLLTLGILGVFYVMPYYMTSLAGYYVEIEAADRSRTYGRETTTHTRTGTTVRSDEPGTWVCTGCGTRNTMSFCTICGRSKTPTGGSASGSREVVPEPPRTTPPARTPDSYFKRPKGF
ncbi:MAG: DUF975 family protein [Clostridiaceae bacterium]